MGSDSRVPASARIVIVGNSGSGKSTLASELASEHDLAHLDLDTLAWEPTTPPTRTPVDVAARELQAFVRRHERWVAEGCYADLVELLLPHADELIFLDRPVDVCQKHARRRPWEPHKYPTKAAQDENLEMLLDWIAAYPDRAGLLGRGAHEALFHAFDGNKRRITR